MLASRLDASQRYTISLLLRTAELSLGLAQPSTMMRKIDEKHARACEKYQSKYLGWGKHMEELEKGIPTFPGVPTSEEFANFYLRRQPFRIDSTEGGKPPKNAELA